MFLQKPRVLNLIPAMGITAGLMLSALSTQNTYAANVADASNSASVTFTGGELSLDNAPEISFGSEEISNYTIELTATAESSGELIVSDLRGNKAGWEVTASLSPFNLGGQGTDAPTLNGATITIADITAEAFDGNAATAPSTESSIVLASNNETTLIASATEGTGMGQWTLGIDNTVIMLTVLPGTAEVGTSYATLTWYLQDTP